MSIVKKSKKNFKAGELLNKNSYFAASIHCFYYSCVQLMIYILNSIFKLSESDIDRLSKEAKTGFHNWLINKISQEAFSKNDIKNRRFFYNNVQQLKCLRINADYKSRVINSNKSQKAREISKQIIKILNNILQVS